MIDIKEQIDLAPMTTFKIGGKAHYFISVKTVGELEEALAWKKEHGKNHMILAGGSNILFSDNGFDGLVIHVANEKVEIKEAEIVVSAGVLLRGFIEKMAEQELSGLENLYGVPGTVGGAVRGNAGAFGTEIKDIIKSVRAYDTQTQKMEEFQVQNCNFSYRNSVFKNERNLIVWEAILYFKKGKKEEIRAQMKHILSERNTRQIQDVQSAGSFFINPEVSDPKIRQRFEKEKGQTCRGNRVPAGWLIDEVGLRGKHVGHVQTGSMHSNYIINNDGGTAEQVIILSSLVKRKVRDELGVQLSEEVTLAGF
ncbi:MAG: UDP-N-acetylmuramate dehydrogenase [Candidatus Moranbacteria bacterium]|nr:UDP-N-acetylmuramate dehydrogenase [Candidatus Moranbacteria bacterium]